MKLMVRGFRVTFAGHGIADGRRRMFTNVHTDHERYCTPPRAIENGGFHFFHFVPFGAAVRALARSWIQGRGGERCRISWLRHKKGAVGQQFPPSAGERLRKQTGASAKRWKLPGRRASDRPKPRSETRPTSRDLLP